MQAQMVSNPLFPSAQVPGFLPSATSELASQRCGCPGQMPMGDPFSGLMQSQQQSIELMGQLLQMLFQLMLGQGAGARPNSALGALGGLGNTAAGGGASAGADAAAAPVNGATTAGGGSADTAPPAGLPKIGPGTKVLEIGDSHTVGAYGQELERLLEGKGAQVTKDAVGGTATHQWLYGTAKAHKLDQLVAQDKPDVVIINLGANQRTQKPGSDIRKLAEMAVKGGAKLIWVGPPTTREDMKDPSKLKQFDDEMRAALGGVGTYISSAPYTPQYVGPDGIHYATAQAKQWAQGIARAITGS